MLARLLGFMLGNRGGLAPTIDSTLSKECMLTAQGPINVLHAIEVAQLCNLHRFG